MNHSFFSFENVAQDFIELFESMGDTVNDTRFRSRVRTSHKDGNFNIEIDMPGYKKDQINLTTEKGVLKIIAVRDDNEFKRQYTLPDDIGHDSATARLEDGILYIAFKKAEKQAGTKIDIN